MALFDYACGHLPIEFESYLHLSRAIRLAGHQAEGRAVQVGSGRSEGRAVQQIERLPPEIDAFAFPKHKAFGHADVLVEGRERAHLWVVPGHVTELVARLA